jgi:hypothetical protein
MEQTLQAAETVRPADLAAQRGLDRLPALPWRDPHSVPPEKLAELIATLKQACLQNPDNAALRTCLGMAHAMNYDVYSSMEALESAMRIAPQDFFAQLKYGELFFRVRALQRAEQETLRGLELAVSSQEMSLARKQLAHIRQTSHGGHSRPPLLKSLGLPAAALAALLAGVSCLYLLWK